MTLDISKFADSDILQEVARRFEEKNASIMEMERMTKNLLELNEKTKHTEAIKSEFLSIIKNEFNNPLSTLLNLSEMLGKKHDSKQFQFMIEMLHSELLKLNFHFRNIFAATEIEAGEITNFYTKIDFVSLFNEVEKSLVYLIEDKELKVTLENRLKEEVVSDYSKLSLILVNLLSNACEYSYPQGEVNVTIYDEMGDFVLEVKDQGEGIEEAKQEKIFDRFHKYSSGKTRAHSGLGLGLSVALGMSEVLGGCIVFYTNAGETCFKVTIPRHNSEVISLGEVGESGMTLFEDPNESIEL